VARYIHDILESSIRKPRSRIKDSWSFASIVRGLNIRDDEVLVLLDVKSMFTNIPKDLVCIAIENRWTEISRATKLTLPQFLHAVNLVLSSMCFTFNGRFYEQIYGSSMGSPLSPILADIVMDDLETFCLFG